MKRSILIIGIALMIFAIGSSALAKDKTPLSMPFGFADANNDGINDLFRDAQGDGIDDVTGRPYPHEFNYVDADKDGMNDLFRDYDGDGRNDMFAPSKGRNRNHGFIPLLDNDADGRNDVTGKKIPGYGFAKPFRSATDALVDEFVDEDNDGIDDRRTWGKGKGWQKKHRHGHGHGHGHGKYKHSTDDDDDQSE